MLDEKQIQILLQLAGSVTPDSMDCDECFCEIARFAEQELAGKTIPEAMQRVQDHLANCPCCQDEFQALLEGLQALDDETS